QVTCGPGDQQPFSLEARKDDNCCKQPISHLIAKLGPQRGLRVRWRFHNTYLCRPQIAILNGMHRHKAGGAFAPLQPITI
ncbi:MAG TPA: hypothetical protein VFC15_07680, partial [Candidatus Limnocylindrales bacterium]|nr:hypothetical protein [Candidatus Limnocylindrales bacterium]